MAKTLTSMVIRKKNSLRSKPTLNLSINGIKVKHGQHTKLLGMIIDHKLSWDKHINNLGIKIGFNLSVIKSFSKYLTHSQKKQVTQALVLKHMDYCSAVWSCTFLGNIRKLQVVQTRQRVWLYVVVSELMSEKCMTLFLGLMLKIDFYTPY